MSANAIQAGVFVMVVVLLVKPIGAYLDRVFERRRTLLGRYYFFVLNFLPALAPKDMNSPADWNRMPAKRKVLA